MGKPRRIEILTGGGAPHRRPDALKTKIVAESLEPGIMVSELVRRYGVRASHKYLQFFFGVSRATVVRRMRQGLMSSVTMAGASVVEDAPLRRFDRKQIRWLLLAIRHHHRRQVSSASLAKLPPPAV